MKDHVISRAKSVSGRIKGFAYHFDDSWVIQKLYMTYELPILEYASQIWSPHYQIQRDRIESVQKLAIFVVCIPKTQMET